MNAQVRDCIVIGAGHNGLVCALTLARAGRSVLVVEAGAQLGGAAATRLFSPGFQVSACAHLLHLMSDDMMRDLQLEAHGLEWAAQGLPTTALVPDAPPLCMPDAAGAGGSALSARDGASYAGFRARMERFAGTLAAVLAETPPRLGTDAWSDRLALLRLGWRLRKLGRRDMRELLRIGAMNVHDLLEENFESPALRGALGFDAVLGTNFGPRSPGTVLTWLYRLAAEHAAPAAAAGGAGVLAQPRGGLGAVGAALGRAAAAAGVVIRTGAPVTSILVEADRACGVVLASGERIEARTVISNADPKTTFLELLGPRHLDTGFVRRVAHLRSHGLAAKLHLALDRLPRFTALDASRLKGRLLIAPSLEYLEHAYNHAKYGEYSAAPAMEITLPTVNDPALAPDGAHVLSAIVQYAPYALKEGWPAARGRFVDLAIDTIEHFAPGLRGSIVGSELLTPVDLEREFRMSGGHWHHGELAFDQFFFVRPVPGATQHRAPVPGLFLCGAGCHPGGGVMGVAGRNAARQILRQAA
jgi:phytoene dehydrogenase-like protein